MHNPMWFILFKMKQIFPGRVVRRGGGECARRWRVIDASCHKVSGSRLTSDMIRPAAPPSYCENETALNSKPLCVLWRSRCDETGISSMRDHALARASAWEKQRSSKRGGFHSGATGRSIVFYCCNIGRWMFPETHRLCAPLECGFHFKWRFTTWRCPISSRYLICSTPLHHFVFYLSLGKKKFPFFRHHLTHCAICIINFFVSFQHLF